MQKKGCNKLWKRCYKIKIYFYSLIVMIMSVFQLKRLKQVHTPHTKHSLATTSTPCAYSNFVQLPNEDSFMQLDTSDIDFDDSPSNRSQSKSFIKTNNSQVFNSTPLNHHNSHTSFRNRNRTELSRTSLV